MHVSTHHNETRRLIDAIVARGERRAADVNRVVFQSQLDAMVKEILVPTDSVDRYTSGPVSAPTVQPTGWSGNFELFNTELRRS